MLRCFMAAATILSVVGVLHSGDQADLRAIIKRAIKAEGGEDVLKKHPARTMKGKGTYYGMGQGLPYTGTWHIQGHQQQKFVITSEVAGMTFTFEQIINGDKGWRKVPGDADFSKLARDDLAAEHDKLFIGYVATLTPLTGRSFVLATVGEVKVDGKDAVGIRASKKGLPDVNLYFDKASGLLVKTEARVKDVRLGEEYQQASYFRDYKDFKGHRYPTKILIEKDGKKLVEAEMTEIQPHEKLEDSIFAAPK